MSRGPLYGHAPGPLVGNPKWKAPEPLSVVLRHHQKGVAPLSSITAGQRCNATNGAEHARQAQGPPPCTVLSCRVLRVERLDANSKEWKKKNESRFSFPPRAAGSSNSSHPFITAYKTNSVPVQFFSLESSQSFPVPHLVTRSCFPTPGSPFSSR